MIRAGWDQAGRDLYGPEVGAGTHGRVFTAALVLAVFALILQVSVVARLGLPFGGRPDLVLTLIAIFALVEGPVAGAVLGFAVGLFGDLLSTHVLGQSVVVLCLVGYCAGLVADSSGRSVRVPLVVVAVATAAGTLGHVALSAILGDSALTGTQTVARAAMAAFYGVLLTPFLFPVLLGGSRWLRGERGERR
jgi:rod shape-determining protein MreD